MSENQEQIKTLRSFGMDNLANLASDLDTASAGRPDVEKAGNAFAAMAKGNKFKTISLEGQLKENPQLAGQVKALVMKDPAAFEKALPAIFANPDQTSALIAQASASKPAAPAAPPAKAEPIQVAIAPAPASAPEHTTTRFNKPEPAPAAQPGTPASPASTASLNAKMEQLSKAEGFNDLMDRAASNPRLADMFKALMATTGSVKEREEALDDVLGRLKENPKMLSNLVNTIDNHHDVVTSISENFAGNPKLGLMTLAKTSEAMNNPVIQFISGIFDKMNFGGGLSGGFGGAGLDRMIVGLLNMVGGLMGGSKDLMGVFDNNGGTRLASAAMEANGVKGDANVTVVDSSGQALSAVTKDEFQKNLRAPQPNAAQPVLGTSAPSAQV